MPAITGIRGLLIKLVLKADRLIDGTGADPISNAALVVENGRIAQITTQDRLWLAPGEEADVTRVATHTHRA
jgi:hypothetical protein